MSDGINSIKHIGPSYPVKHPKSDKRRQQNQDKSDSATEPDSSDKPEIDEYI